MALSNLPRSVEGNPVAFPTWKCRLANSSSTITPAMMGRSIFPKIQSLQDAAYNARRPRKHNTDIQHQKRRCELEG
jgi:hypothetical protein